MYNFKAKCVLNAAYDSNRELHIEDMTNGQLYVCIRGTNSNGKEIFSNLIISEDDVKLLEFFMENRISRGVDSAVRS